MGPSLSSSMLSSVGSTLILLAFSLTCKAREARDPSAIPQYSLSYSEALEYANSGGFDYEALRSASDRLIVVLEDEHVSRQPQDPARAKAYWIDAYNRNVLSSVLRAGITTSVMDAEYKFFDRKLFRHFGQELSLNDIEKRMLFAQFPDARLHFALVCGANSCPPLYDKPFSEADDLDRLLDSLTARSVHDTLFVRFDAEKGEVLLSRLFEWYEKDFETEAGSVMEFIAKYHDQGDALLKRKWKKKFRNYDWSLNQRPRLSE